MYSGHCSILLSILSFDLTSFKESCTEHSFLVVYYLYQHFLIIIPCCFASSCANFPSSFWHTAKLLIILYVFKNLAKGFDDKEWKHFCKYFVMQEQTFSQNIMQWCLKKQKSTFSKKNISKCWKVQYFHSVFCICCRKPNGKRVKRGLVVIQDHDRGPDRGHDQDRRIAVTVKGKSISRLTKLQFKRYLYE